MIQQRVLQQEIDELVRDAFDGTIPEDRMRFEANKVSATNQTMRDHLRSIAKEAAALVGKTSGHVLDIGCNDGTLLANYGVEPSNVASSSKTKFRLVQDVFPSAELLNLLEDSKLDVITVVAMLYDLEDSVHFTRGIRGVLAPNGLGIFEMSYMPSMLEANSYDTICFEHLEYYSLAVIENILHRADMKAFRATFNSINGGSVRVYATHRLILSSKTRPMQKTYVNCVNRV